MKDKLTYLWLLCLLSLAACVDTIRFEPDPDDLQIVVYGQVTTHPGPTRIKIGRVQAFGSAAVVPVRSARVILKSDAGEEEAFAESEAGLYETKGEIIRGTVGRAYWVEIKLVDGREIYSRPEVLPAVPTMDSLSLVFTDKILPRSRGLAEFQKFVDAYVSTPIPQQEKGPYLRWESEDAWSFTERDDPRSPFDVPKICYRLHQKPNPQAIILFNGDELKVDQWASQFIASRRIDSTFSERHYFLAFQYSMTEEAWRYWSQLDEVANLVGSIFDRPPALIQGNLYNPNDPKDLVLGYVEANAVDTAFNFVLPLNFAPWRLEDRYCPTLPWLPNMILPRICYNCMRREAEFVYDRPYYWGQ
ncbi:MAG: DUF4249 family protein [Bacteroidota bacterium]